jgi:hypothetical protein
MMHTKVTSFLTVLFLAFLPFTAAAQNDPFREMEREIMELQRRMMQNLQNNPFFGDKMSPEGRGDSSSFFFRFDTTLTNGRMFRFDTTFSNGNSGFHFFFGRDTTAQQFFRGFGQLFGDMMDMNDGFGWEERQPEDADNPRDDGHRRRQNDDGLLPEERLRKEEKQPEEGKKSMDADDSDKSKKEPAPAKKSKIKTTRI